MLWHFIYHIEICFHRCSHIE
uniref:Uncharacterized protein n=1 Tax=Rhizophora mucronata TaxID=61149 RepID=A0A2P2J3J0_RHIMU